MVGSNKYKSDKSKNKSILFPGNKFEDESTNDVIICLLIFTLYYPVISGLQKS